MVTVPPLSSEKHDQKAKEKEMWSDDQHFVFICKAYLNSALLYFPF